MLQRFNKKDSATSEEPDERDLRDLMKFVEDDTLKGIVQTPVRGLRGNAFYCHTYYDP